MLTQDEIHKMAAVESDHWWYRGMREMFFALLAPHLRAVASHARGSQMRILDVGCGTGGNLVELSKHGAARGIDADPLCVDYCRGKGLDVRLATMENLGEAPGSIDLLTMFDVVCQAEPPETPLIFQSFAEALAPGGLFAFREPAMPVAAGAHDRAVGGKQRFTVRRLRTLLTEAGLQPLRITYVNSLLFAPIVLQRRIGDLINPTAVESDVKPAPPPLNTALLGILRAEQRLLRFTNMPFGVSIFAVARKKM